MNVIPPLIPLIPLTFLLALAAPLGCAATTPPPAPSAVAPSGGVGASASRVVASMAPAFRRCYNAGLREDAEMAGGVRMTAKLDAAGEVVSVDSGSPVGLSSSVVECLRRVVLAARFAPPAGGGVTTIVMPVQFNAIESPPGATEPLQTRASHERPATGPRVHVSVMPAAASPAVELRQVVGKEYKRWSTQSAYGGGSGYWEFPVTQRVCAAPCDVVVDGRGSELLFGGPTLTDSLHFTLTDKGGEVFFTVRPGKQIWHDAGGPLAGIGAAGVVVGGVLLSVGGAGDSDFVKPGAALLGVGSAVFAIGLSLFLSGRTTYTMERPASP